MCFYNLFCIDSHAHHNFDPIIGQKARRVIKRRGCSASPPRVSELNQLTEEVKACRKGRCGCTFDLAVYKTTAEENSTCVFP